MTRRELIDLLESRGCDHFIVIAGKPDPEDGGLITSMFTNMAQEDAYELMSQLLQQRSEVHNGYRH